VAREGRRRRARLAISRIANGTRRVGSLGELA